MPPVKLSAMVASNAAKLGLARVNCRMHHKHLATDGWAPTGEGIRMIGHNLESVAASLVADGKGILAADETVPTLTKRFDTLGIKSTEQSRRTYREMLARRPRVHLRRHHV